MAMGLHGTGRRRRGGTRRAPMAEINVTPLVDVMLVLLIIFMVTAPLLTAGVPIDLPDSRARALDREANEISVAIVSGGDIYVEDEAVPTGGLALRLAEIPREGGGGPPVITLRADRGLDYGRVMAVMGELNRAGFSQISLVTTGSAEGP